jgi:hypothetical protein
MRAASRQQNEVRQTREIGSRRLVAVPVPMRIAAMVALIAFAAVVLVWSPALIRCRQVFALDDLVKCFISNLNSVRLRSFRRHPAYSWLVILNNRIHRIVDSDPLFIGT